MGRQTPSQCQEKIMNKLTIATALLLVGISTSTSAQVPADPHHPEAGNAPATTQPTPPRMGGMSMPDMMRMMQGMRMMGPGMGGMGTIDRVEGRIAFLRAETKITDAQTNVWNAFADALRTNAQKLSTIRAAMMPQPGAASQQTLAARLDVQERWLVARLEGTRAIKVAFTNLVGTLSDDQKKTANELLAPHMGMGPMEMMSGQMGPSQMGPTQMQRPPAR